MPIIYIIHTYIHTYIYIYTYYISYIHIIHIIHTYIHTYIYTHYKSYIHIVHILAADQSLNSYMLCTVSLRFLFMPLMSPFTCEGQDVNLHTNCYSFMRSFIQSYYSLEATLADHNGTDVRVKSDILIPIQGSSSVTMITKHGPRRTPGLGSKRLLFDPYICTTVIS